MLRTVAIPTLVFIALLSTGVVQPSLWNLSAGPDDSPAVVWRARAYCIALWLVGALMAQRWVCLVVLDGLATRAAGKPLPEILKDVLAIVFMAAAAAGILVTVFEQSMAGFWAASGVFGLVLGIALRPIILDFFSGLGANLEGAYSIGDWISVAGEEGEPIRGWIEQINWRTLRLRTRDGFIVLLPNSRLATSAVTNHAIPHPASRFQIRLRLDSEVPANRALRILISAVNAATTLPDGPRRHPSPEALITDASGEGIEYMVRFWFDPGEISPDTVTHVVWKCVIEHLSKAGLTFAHPRNNVFLGRLPRIAGGLHQVEDRLAFLRRVELFHNFPEASLHRLAAEVRLRCVRPAHVLVRAGDPGDSMFLVAEGTLRVLGSGGSSPNPVELAVLQPGDVFGERSLLTGEPRSASVAAVTECILLEIHREALQLLTSSEPVLLKLLEQTIAGREQANQQRTGALDGADATPPSPSRTQTFIAHMRSLFAGEPPHRSGS